MQNLSKRVDIFQLQKEHLKIRKIKFVLSVAIEKALNRINSKQKNDILNPRPISVDYIMFKCF